MEIKANYKNIPIDLIDPNPWNPNEQTDFMFEKQKNSLETFGQVLPILVREKKGGRFEIVDGEHRYRAALEKGAKEISANNLGEVEDGIVLQLTDVLNSLKGTNNQEKLSKYFELLTKKVSIEDAVKVMPYQPDEIRAILKVKEIDWNQVKAQIPVTKVPTPEPEEKDSSSSLPPNGAVVIGETDGYETLTIRLPKEEMELFAEQIDRIKGLLYPEDDPNDVSNEPVFAAILQAVIQTDDEFFTGSEE